VPFRFEDGFVAVSVLELDLEGAVVEKFGGSFAIDLVAFLAAGSVKANGVARVFDFTTPRTRPKAPPAPRSPRGGSSATDDPCQPAPRDRRNQKRAPARSSLPRIHLSPPQRKIDRITQRFRCLGTFSTAC